MNLANLLTVTNTIPLIEKPCTATLLELWKDTSPLLQKKILINCHLTNATLLLVELFLCSGAELKITCTDNLVCHHPVKNLVEELKIYIPAREIITPQYENYFDAVLDCGAYLADVLKPKKGFIELTHVELSRYKTTDCPIISVDKSFIKRLETTFGTGDGFVRAIDYIYSQKNQNFREKAYMIFGYGKVGEGISSCLQNAGVAKTNIIIIEACEKKIKDAQSKGFFTYSISYDKEKIKEFLSEQLIDCAVTATGVKNCISKNFLPAEFKKVECLANMGTYDEWGEAFSEEIILNKKQPLNFMLEYPTKISFLDPSLALLACATLDMIKENMEAKFCVENPKIESQKQIMDFWLKNDNNTNFKPFVGELWEEERRIRSQIS